MIFHQPDNSRSNYNFNTAFYKSEVWNYHFHKNPELIYVIDGQVECTVNGKRYLLSAGDFGLCLSCDIHKYEPGDNTRYWVLVFSEDYVRYFVKRIGGKRAEGFKFRPSGEVLEYTQKRLVYNEKPTVFTVKSCLYGILEDYLNQVSLTDGDRGDMSPIIQLTDYILENHTKKITLSDAAKKFGYDYNYMSRFFRKNFNMTFGEFLLAYRLETAARLLDDTEKSITEVALESGFQSVRNFNRAFKEKMKVSPSDYRRAKT
jgi:AraC-like DNA-binding protein